METIRNRFLIIFVILILTSVLVNFLTYEAYHEAEAGIRGIKNIPLEIGKWEGKDVFLEEKIYEILETRSIIHRNYLKNGQNAFLSLVYHPETKVDFHSPEYCFGAQGVELVKTTKNITIIYDEERVNISVNKLIYQKNGFDELVYYFYKSGGFLGQSYIKLRLSLAVSKLSNRSKSGSLVRVSTPILNGDIQRASNSLGNFIEDLYPYLIAYL